jgi:AcrR family transcriptional regulator
MPTPRQRRRPPHQLPPGRHGLSREEVREHQRTRIFAAVAETVTVMGYADTAVEDIIAAAGVSRRTFYDLFPNKDEAFLAAFDYHSERLFAAVTGAYDAAAPWPARVPLGVRMFLLALASDPKAAHLCLVGVLAAGPRALARREAAMARFAELLDEGRAFAPPDRVLPATVAQTIVGGIHEVVYARLVRGEAAALPDLLPDIVYAILLPFVGADAARTEYERLQDKLDEREAASRAAAG